MVTLERQKTRSFLHLADVNADELEELLDLAALLKDEPFRFADALANETIAMFFEKPSTRTRSSFAVAAYRRARPAPRPPPGAPPPPPPPRGRRRGCWGGGSRSPTPHASSRATSPRSSS